jgi:uncharacterized LabA/DUF88 family protein
MAGRAMVFIDGSNFFGACRDFRPGMKIDFEKLSSTLVQHCGATEYQGTYYYGSYPPSGPETTPERKKRLANQFRFFEALDYLKGYTVRKFPRKTRKTTCESCGKTIEYTVEKGVDSSMVTEMISLAWEDAFDIAVLVSEDADLVPAVQFLNRVGKKVYHAYFTKLGRGHELRKACFGQIPLDLLIADVQVPE